MTRVLVTGGTGELGSHVVAGLDENGYTVRIMSRRPSQLPTDSDREWAQADLETGNGLASAVDGVDVVVHTASDPRNSAAVDVAGTRKLVAQAADAGVDQFVYVSIVGIDAWEDGWFPYYRHKLAAEAAVEASDLRWAILRATQFHSFLDSGFSALRWAPIWPIPTRFQLQPVAPAEVADRLVAVVDDDARGRVPDFGGPETHHLGTLASTWQASRGTRRPVVRVPIPGTIASRVRDGAMVAADGDRGTVTWREWLQRNQ